MSGSVVSLTLRDTKEKLSKGEVSKHTLTHTVGSEQGLVIRRHTYLYTLVLLACSL